MGRTWQLEVLRGGGLALRGLTVRVVAHCPVVTSILLSVRTPNSKVYPNRPCVLCVLCGLKQVPSPLWVSANHPVEWRSGVGVWAVPCPTSPALGVIFRSWAGLLTVQRIPSPAGRETGEEGVIWLPGAGAAPGQNGLPVSRGNARPG